MRKLIKICLMALEFMPFRPKQKILQRRTQRIPESSYTMKATVDIDIFIKSRNGNRRILPSIRITSGPPTRNGEDLIQPVHMNIFQNYTYTTDLD